LQWILAHHEVSAMNSLTIISARPGKALIAWATPLPQGDHWTKLFLLEAAVLSHSMQLVASDDQSDTALFFTPDKTAVIAEWAYRSFWTPAQCAALAWGRNPASVTPEIVGIAPRGSRFAESFQRLKAAIETAQSVGELRDRIRPIDYFNWARLQGLPFWEDLEKAVRDNDRDLRERIEQLERRNRELEFENRQLRTGKVLLEEDAHRRGAETNSKPSRNKMIIAMAIENYGYRPNRPIEDQPKKSAVTAIHDAMAKLGLRCDDKTVRTALDEGAGLVKKDVLADLPAPRHGLPETGVQRPRL
jgi:hypothetical protein